MSDIEQLQAAGFSQDEISAWAVDRRNTLTAAGFKPNEIDAYFAGGPVVSDEIPEAMVRRLQAGEEARKREGGLMQTIPQFAHMIGTPEGRTRLWDAVKQYPARFVEGMVDQLKVPGEVAKGNIDLNTPDGLDQAIGLGMLVTGSRLSKLPVTGKTSGIGVQLGEKVSRIDRTPTGELVDVPVGGLAKTDDFVAASRAIGEDAAMARQDKLLKMYEEQGAHPAEVAHDASTNPVIKQKMLSSDPLDVPEGYAPSLTVEQYVSDYIAGKGRDNKEYLQFAANNAAEIEAEFARRLSGQDRINAPPKRDARQVQAEILRTEQEQAKRQSLLSDEESLSEYAADKGISKEEMRALLADNYKNAEDHLPKLREELRSAPQANTSGINWKDIPDPPAAETMVASGGGGKGGAPPSAPPSPGSFEAAQAKILDKISVGDRESKPLSWSKLYTQTVDDLHPIQAVSEDAYQAARLVRGQFGKADTFINNGTFDFNTYKTTGPALADVLAPVRDDLQPFRAFITARRAIEIAESGRQPGFDLAAAREVVAHGEAKYGKVADDLVAYQNELLRYLKDSGVLSEKAYGAMAEANKAYIPFFRAMLPDEPFPGTGKGFGPGNPIHKLKGSDRGIIDPLESVIKNTYAYISVAERNAAGVKIVDALQEQGLKAKAAPRSVAEADFIDYLKQNGVRDPEALIDFVKSTAADDGTAISAWKDGKRISVEVNDPELVRAFRGLDQQSAGLLTKVFAAPASALRAGAVLSPDFMARNLLRDFMTAFVNSKGLFSPIDTLKGFKSAVAKDDVYWNWKKAGGDNATMVALDRRYLQESIKDLTAETGLGTRAWNVVTSPLAGLRMVSELTEQATRLGEFQKVLKGMETKEMMQTAAYTSREVTLDFSRMGAKMRAYNMVTAFANAQIQGLDRIVRASVDRPFNTAAKIAGGVTLPSILLWWANKDDERVKELPQWQRDLFWIIPTDKWEPISLLDAQDKPPHLLRRRDGQWEVNNGHIWRLPKPFEVGVLFGSGVERALDQMASDNPEAFDGFVRSIWDMLTPSVIPTAGVPLYEQWANRSSFTDRTLIPAPVEKLLPEYQYTPYTTELSKALGRVVASFPGLREASVQEGNVAGPVARATSSPILIENYLRAWTGGLGMYALNTADYGLRKSGVLPDPVTPTPTLADIPFIKAFAVRYPSASAESIQKFYDDYARDKRYFDTWQAKAKEGDAEAMAKVQAAGGPQMFLRLDAIRTALSEHSTLIRDVYKAPDIPAEEKRQLIDGLYYAMIEIGQAGRSAMKEGRAALDKPAE